MPTSSAKVGSRKGHRVTVGKWKNHPDYKWRADFVEGGKNKRKGFKTKTAAEEWAEEREAEALNFGTSSSISQSERAAVLETRSELAEVGLTVREAIGFAVEFHKNTKNFCTVDELVQKAIADRQRSGRSDRHTRDLRSKLGRFSKEFGQRHLFSINKDEIEDWLHGLGLKAKSFNSYRTAVVTLFNDGERNGLIRENPASKIPTATISESKYSALPPVDVAALLGAADSEIQPAIAIGLFAGMRDQEIKRLDWSSINLEGSGKRPFGHIWFEGEGAKTRKNRVVPISENLQAWLLPHAKNEGPVWPENGRKLHEAARLAAGYASPSVVDLNAEEGKCLSVWPNNALRHSFASYHLAHHEDAAALAIYMGTSQEMIFRNYLALVDESDAEAFWSILPENSH